MKKTPFTFGYSLIMFLNILNVRAQKGFDDITFGKYRCVHSEIMNENLQLFFSLH